ncbi:MAG TPA: GspH/FimT family pseudopilin, partial [Longimicrobiaceae bacterium]|nr:GspH/FimT family pseudopilin [Longimicrobiaceae bacterium]
SATGFTLVESLTTLVVVGVLASLAVPSLRQEIATIRVIGVLDQLQSDLMLARMMAARDGAPSEVRFTADADGCIVEYLLVPWGAAGSATAIRRRVEAGATGVCLRGGRRPKPVRFDARGLVRKGARTFSVTQDDREYALVLSFAGRVRRVERGKER